MTKKVLEQAPPVPSVADDAFNRPSVHYQAEGKPSSIFRESNRRRVIAATGTPRVKSEFAADTDINRIVARIKRTGDYSALNLDKSWNEQDFTQFPNNYTDAALLLKRTKDSFMSLSSEERQKFDNDPGRWVDHLQQSQTDARKAAIDAHAVKVQDAQEEANYRKARRKAVISSEKPPSESKS